MGAGKLDANCVPSLPELITTPHCLIRTQNGAGPHCLLKLSGVRKNLVSRLHELFPLTDLKSSLRRIITKEIILTTCCAAIHGDVAAYEADIEKISASWIAQLPAENPPYTSEKNIQALLDQILAERLSAVKSRKMPRSKANPQTASISIPALKSDSDLGQHLQSQSPGVGSTSHTAHKYSTRQNTKSTSGTDGNDLGTSLVQTPVKPEWERMQPKKIRPAFHRLQSKDKRGFIYVARWEEHPEYVKIGFTTCPAEKRVREISRSCKREFTLMRSFPCESWLQRVEHFIHAELSAERWRETSTSCVCGRQHREWFTTSQKRALEVAEAWTMWISAAQPFDVDGRLTSRWQTLLNTHIDLQGDITVAALQKVHRQEELREALARIRVIEKQNAGIVVSVIAVDDSDILASPISALKDKKSGSIPSTPSPKSGSTIHKHGLLTPGETPDQLGDGAKATQSDVPTTPVRKGAAQRAPLTPLSNGCNKMLNKVDMPYYKLEINKQKQLSLANLHFSSKTSVIDDVFVTPPSSPVSITA